MAGSAFPGHDVVASAPAIAVAVLGGPGSTDNLRPLLNAARLVCEAHERSKVGGVRNLVDFVGQSQVVLGFANRKTVALEETSEP